VNVAALNGNGSHGGSGHGLALGNGIRLINGVPCGPDGRPLTGAAATAALVSLGITGSHGGGSKTQEPRGNGGGSSQGSPSMSGGQPPVSAGSVASNDGQPSGTSGGTNAAPNAASPSTHNRREREDLSWQTYNGYDANRYEYLPR
jgi:hypothetical protein